MKTKATSASNQWAGRTTISSGDATVVVSTSIVKSDSIIQYGIEANTRQNSGFANTVEITTISDSTHFILGTSDGVAAERDVIVMWNIVQTK